MPKKRTSLDSLFAGDASEKAEQSIRTEKIPEEASAPPDSLKVKAASGISAGSPSKTSAKSKSDIVKQTVYLPAAVHEQLRQLAFEERRKMHDYLVEGLDRVFKDRGLKPYSELSRETE